MKNVSKIYVGVDISKDNLDIYFYPIGKYFSVANSGIDIEELIERLAEYDIAQIACESTGGYEKLLEYYLKKHSYTLWIVDPRRIKGFIIASGCKSKTDKIDAQKIAEFAAKTLLDYKKISKTENQEKIQALANRKNDLLKFLVAEKIRLKHPVHRLSIPSIKKIIQVLTREIESIDLQIQSLIQQDDGLGKKSKILESIPGIGKATSAILLSFVPELGMLNNKQISALVGLCPYDYASGKYKGKKFIKGGRITPRNALYMCGLTTIKFYLPLKGFYDRLIANNKPFKVAIVAVMHKLVVIANSLIKKGELCKANTIHY